MNKIVHYSDSPRVGRFRLPNSTREERPLVEALLRTCTTILSHEPVLGGEEFYATHPAFDELAEGDEIPLYRIDFVANGQQFENPEHEARRVNHGHFGFVFTRQFILRIPAVHIRTTAVSLH